MEILVDIFCWLIYHYLDSNIKEVSMKKLLVIFIAILAASTISVSAQASKFSGTEIRILAGSIPWTDYIKFRIPEFTQKTGIKVVLEIYPEEILRNKITVELTARNRDLDVYTMSPPQETMLFVKNGWLTPIDEFVKASPEYDIADYIPSALAGGEVGGKLYAIPLFTERPVLYYRTDIFAKAGIKPPKTFDELMADAKLLNNPSAKIYGFVERGAGNPAVTQFVTFLRGFGGDYQSADYRTATINTPEAIKAYQYYGEILRNYGPPGVLNMNWGETSNLFAQGLVAMRIDNDSQFAQVVDKNKSLVWDKVGFATVPAGPAGMGSCNVAPWALCIPSYSAKKAAAWEFIRWATSKEISLGAMQAGQFGARQSVWKNPEATKGLPADLVAAVQGNLGTKYSNERPVMVQVGKARDIIGTVIQAAITGKTDAELKVIADKANAEFQQLLDQDYK